MKIIVLIPARLESSRLPKKPLLDIQGMSMIIHVAKRSKFSKKASLVSVCTDSLEIVEECIKYGINCIITKKSHTNGTERISEAVKNINTHDDDVVIDVQGDEPLIHPETIDKLITKFIKSKFDIMLPYLETNDMKNINIVKLSTVGNEVIYMSRADIPFPFSNDRKLKKHLSIVAFKTSALKKYSTLKKSRLENIESIELLRAIENKLKIGTFKENLNSFSVDVNSDYQKANRKMQNDKLFTKYREK